MTFLDLYKSCTEYRGNPDKTYPHMTNLKLSKVSLMKGVKTVYYTGDVMSQQGSSDYMIQLVFGLINTSDEEVKGYLPFTMDDGTVTYYEVPSLKDSPVRMRCSCSDFRFRFMYPNSLKKALFGKVRRYTRVQNSNRPPVNPDNIPGYCKHIHNFTAALLTRGFVRN
jgi:hypothetical protein